MNYYPIFLDLRGRPCLVVGGSETRQKKRGLLARGRPNGHKPKDK